MQLALYEQTAKAKPKAVIYFLEAMIYPADSDLRYCNLFKIGYSRHPEQRLARLQFMSPVTLVLRGIMPGEASVEAALHARFATSHSHGEWYRGDEVIIDYIYSNCCWLNRAMK